MHFSESPNIIIQKLPMGMDLNRIALLHFLGWQNDLRFPSLRWGNGSLPTQQQPFTEAGNAR
jgi:hypothetical protein